MRADGGRPVGVPGHAGARRRQLVDHLAVGVGDGDEVLDSVEVQGAAFAERVHADPLTLEVCGHRLEAEQVGLALIRPERSVHVHRGGDGLGALPALHAAVLSENEIHKAGRRIHSLAVAGSAGAECGAQDGGGAEVVGVGLALVAQHIGFVEDDQRWGARRGGRGWRAAARR
jgi:hypothetical protein